MGRHKTNCTLSPWLTAHVDNKEKRFIMVGNSLLFNKNFQSLTHGARDLYYSMTMEAAGHVEFEFPLATAKKHGFPQVSFRRYVNELRDGGFIELVSSGKITREPNKYRFSLRWKLDGAKD